MLLYGFSRSSSSRTSDSTWIVVRLDAISEPKAATFNYGPVMPRGMGKDERHFLTRGDDVPFLLGEKDLTEGSAQNARSRIRTRLRCALQDMEFLADHQSGWKSRMFVKGMSDDDEDEIYNGIISAIGLMYSLVIKSDKDAEEVFEAGIRKAEGPLTRDVNVDIDIEHHDMYDFDSVRSKIEGGELPSAWEIGVAAMNGDIDQRIRFGEDTRPMREWVQVFAEDRDERVELPDGVREVF